MRSWLLTALTVSPFLLSASSWAQGVPRYDVERHCNKVAASGGQYSEMIMSGCVDMEQGAYDGLKLRWGHLPSSIRSHCDRVARFGGAGSYSTLEGCVQMEENSAQSNRSRTFRY